jgi:hypothetical protein
MTVVSTRSEPNVVASRLRRRPRWLAPTMAAVALGGVALLVANLCQATPPVALAPPSGAAALTAYTTALRQPTAAGGAIVAEEMRPSLGEFASGAVDPATFSRRAAGWRLAMTQVRQRIDAITVPPTMRSAAQLFDQALTEYVHAATLFAAVGESPAAQRQALVDGGMTAATQADALYDRAAAVVQSGLRQAGLPTDTLLPDAASPGTAS